MSIYGLIGNPLSHSFSAGYFAKKFAAAGIGDATYNNYELPSIKDLPALLADHPDLRGLNVTIPYKEQVLPFLHRQHEVVAKIGACNCIRMLNGELTGYNTDVVGFEQSLIQLLKPSHKKALILGTGGSSKSVAYVLEKLGIPFIYVSRKVVSAVHVDYASLTPDMIREHQLIINSTPIGMFPKNDEAPELPYEAIGSQHYLFDLVYNPAETSFLKKGAFQGAVVKNGADMLMIQAEESWKIWNG